LDMDSRPGDRCAAGNDSVIEEFKYGQVGRCVNSVTHDVNNYLGAILAYAELVSLDPGTSEDSKRMLSDIVEAVRKSSGLMSTLTSIARPEKPVTSMVDVVKLVEQAVQNFPETDFSARYVDLLRDAYKPGVTLAEGFTGVLSSLLAPLGMCFVDASSPAVKTLSAPLLIAELDRAEAHEALLREDADKLEGAGFAAQVRILEGAVNLFLEGPGGRERIYRNGKDFELRPSRETVSAEAVRERAESDPLALSPNVLLRPVVESTIFPVISYVAGPGEAAYYAQIKRLFEAHGLMMPVIYPRHAVTVVEAKVRKKLDKFGLDLERLQRPLHEIMSEIARDEVPQGVRQALEEIKSAVDRGSADLLEAATSIDPTLKGPVTKARNNALSAFQAAERKIVQSVKRENEVATSQVEVAQRHLFPGGQPQERMLAPFYYLVRYGSDFVASLAEGFAVDLAEETE
ncbi:MAG: bacillithiol biosynthesis cysteine-adding enzyme BshC, partial [Gemmatimonadetes bacterium]|nr:bacillithiol biosynthesis cysteine-adding enzyme BshC [Gemmatimonadota bacterium]